MKDRDIDRHLEIRARLERFASGKRRADRAAEAFRQIAAQQRAYGVARRKEKDHTHA